MKREVNISSQCFLLGFGVVSFFLFRCNNFNEPAARFLSSPWIYCPSFFGVMNFVLLFVYRGNDWQIAVRSIFLGLSCGIGFIFSVVSPLSYKPFGWYLFVLSFFHYSEYFITGVTNPSTLSLDSFLLNHSIAYWVAASSSWIEFFIERWFFPFAKEYWYISLIGMLICVFGEVMRKLAMITANTNFNHIVQVNRKENHQLVTWGIYKYSRHPSYVGWFWWSIGTQMILMNPLCLIAYAVTSWSFFNDRVYFEEMTLIKFFGQKYIDYKKKVGTGLPFIKGYKIMEIQHTRKE